MSVKLVHREENNMLIPYKQLKEKEMNLYTYGPKWIRLQNRKRVSINNFHFKSDLHVISHRAAMAILSQHLDDVTTDRSLVCASFKCSSFSCSVSLTLLWSPFPALFKAILLDCHIDILTRDKPPWKESYSVVFTAASDAQDCTEGQSNLPWLNFLYCHGSRMLRTTKRFVIKTNR